MDNLRDCYRAKIYKVVKLRMLRMTGERFAVCW